MHSGAGSGTSEQLQRKLQRSGETPAVERLSAYFPQAVRIQMQARITFTQGGLEQRAVLQFATAREVLFALEPPVEFGDQLRLETQDGLLSVDATVVAMQMTEGDLAVAAKFDQEVPTWIIRE